jgi:hypothetical protein
MWELNGRMMAFRRMGFQCVRFDWVVKDEWVASEFLYTSFKFIERFCIMRRGHDIAFSTRVMERLEQFKVCALSPRISWKKKSTSTCLLDLVVTVTQGLCDAPSRRRYFCDSGPSHSLRGINSSKVIALPGMLPARESSGAHTVMRETR